MELIDTTLTLFFTKQVGLKTWADVGTIDRELTLYRNLSVYLRKVNMVTYGGCKDRVYRINLEILKFYRLRGIIERLPLFNYC